MKAEKREDLRERVVRAAEAALAAQQEVSPIDVLLGIGWLYPGAVPRWRQGQEESLLGGKGSTHPARCRGEVRRCHAP